MRALLHRFARYVRLVLRDPWTRRARNAAVFALISHAGPIHLKVNLGSLDQERTEALIDDPTAISAAGQSAVDDVTNGVLRLALRAMGAAVATALLLSALIFRNIRRVAGAGGAAVLGDGGRPGGGAGP